jgi:hypothetical protein
MANPVCNISSLNVACFDDSVIDAIRRKALMVFFKATELKLIGGTDYTGNLIGSGATGLVGATVQFADSKVGLDNIGTRYIGTYELAIAHANAVAAGMPLVATISARMAQIACLLNVNESLLDRMNVFLECQLGVHKAYTQ